MKTQHTPGPWVAVHGSNGYSIGAQEKPDCFPKSRLCDIIKGTEQDAYLIAAAPDLLAALENALNVMAGIATGDLKAIGRDSPAIAQARAAIARARGA